MMRINRDLIKTFSTLKEIEILQKQLKGQIRYTEKLVKSDFQGIITGQLSLIGGDFIRNGLSLSLKYLTKSLLKRWS